MQAIQSEFRTAVGAMISSTELAFGVIAALSVLPKQRRPRRSRV